jgi:serine phosphatase RsbU (regulator of sigma subunit)
MAFVLSTEIAGESNDAEPIEGLDIAVRYIPMSSVAGDFSDFIVVDDKHLGILVADVSGHGMPAALIASMRKSHWQPTRCMLPIRRKCC